MPTAMEQASPWLQGRTFASWQDEFDGRGYLIFERVLSPDRVAEIRAVAARLAAPAPVREDFEGLKTNRVYALLAKSPLFAELATTRWRWPLPRRNWDRPVCCRRCLPSTSIPVKRCSPGISKMPA